MLLITNISFDNDAWRFVLCGHVYKSEQDNAHKNAQLNAARNIALFRLDTDWSNRESVHQRHRSH